MYFDDCAWSEASKVGGRLRELGCVVEPVCAICSFEGAMLLNDKSVRVPAFKAS